MKNFKANQGQILLKNLFAKRRVKIHPEAVAAVRGPGYWGLLNKNLSKARKEQWNLYKHGKFKELISKTNGKSNSEALYLNTMSRYHSSKNGNSFIVKNLNKVVESSYLPGLRLEARRDLVYIHFENGNFTGALEILKQMERTLSWQDWDDRSFYILIMTHFYLGHKQKATTYKSIMKKYYPISPLVKYLPV